MSDSLIPSFLVSDVSESLRLLTINERCEQIAQVAPKNERSWANRSGRSFFRKNGAIRSETDEQIPSPV